MATTVVLHHVKDYQAWRKVYDEVGPLQREGGVIAESVYQAKGDPNNVLVLHRFATMQAAETFFTNPQLLDALHQAGVEDSLASSSTRKRDRRTLSLPLRRYRHPRSGVNHMAPSTQLVAGGVAYWQVL